MMSVCLSVGQCVISPAVVISDEELSHSTPVQMPAVANSH